MRDVSQNMSRRTSISMRKLARAAAQAGAGATPERVATHYVAPELARYITGTDAGFLKEVSERAQPIADQLAPPTVIPTTSELEVTQMAFRKIKSMELLWGWGGVIAMSIVCGIWFASSTEGMAWLGFMLPFLGPGFLAYIFVAQIGASIAKSSQDYNATISMAARILVAEREKTAYWKNLSWRDLEHRVAALFQRRGYTAYATPGSGDKGVDVVAESSSEKIVIQCKQYSKPAQRNLVSELLGVMIAEQADRAILICTGGYTKGAEEYALENGITLWDLDDLARENAKNNG